MRFPTAIVAATVLALTFAYPASADFNNPALYTAFDNHLLADPVEPAVEGTPSPLGGCTGGNSNFGGCLFLPATAAGQPYHANIAASDLILGGADDFLLGAQVCFFDASKAPIECQQGFVADDGHGGLDDSLTQLANYGVYDSLGNCLPVVHQSTPANAAFFDIEAGGVAINIVGAFWQDATC